MAKLRMQQKGTRNKGAQVSEDNQHAKAAALTAKPRGSRSVSGEPRSWMTVEKRTMTGVCTPGARNMSAHVRWLMSCVTCVHAHVAGQQFPSP